MLSLFFFLQFPTVFLVSLFYCIVACITVAPKIANASAIIIIVIVTVVVVVVVIIIITNIVTIYCLFVTTAVA